MTTTTPTKPTMTQAGTGPGLGLALGVLTVWLIELLAGISVPAEPATAIGVVWTYLGNRLVRRFG